MFLHCPINYGETKLSNAAIEKALGVSHHCSWRSIYARVTAQVPSVLRAGTESTPGRSAQGKRRASSLSRTTRGSAFSPDLVAKVNSNTLAHATKPENSR